MRYVAVLIESSRGYGRGLIAGISRYVHEHGPWSIYFEPRDLEDPPPKWLGDWRGDGILVRLNDHKMLEAVLKTGVPAIDVRGRLENHPLPLVGGDNPRMTEMVFSHLRDQGLRNFAFCGVPVGTGINRFLDLRRQTFVQLVQATGCQCDIFEISGNESHSSPNWEREVNRMESWLAGLPKPVGLMACDDHRGLQLLDACRRRSIRVPDEVAVVGVNNDTVLCHLADPPLSSVDPGAENIGYQAAGCLDKLMNGGSLIQAPLFLQPLKLVARRSSDTIAVEDRDLAAALRYIRNNACAGISVYDVLEQVPISRSGLERKFTKTLGRSPKAEILRIQIQQVERLLGESTLSLAEIARRTGFVSEKYLSDAFQRECGIRPTAFRKKIL